MCTDVTWAEMEHIPFCFPPTEIKDAEMTWYNGKEMLGVLKGSVTLGKVMAHGGDRLNGDPPRKEVRKSLSH